MKSQLLQDIGENGGRPAAVRVTPPVTPPDAPTPAPASARPAVWRARGPGREERLREEVAPPVQPAAPTVQPAPSASTPPPGPPPAQDPDWLAGRLQQAAAEHGETVLASAWSRRALGFGLGGLLLAGLAAAGWWAVEEQRVAGALAVVARTEPVAPSRSGPQVDQAPPVGNPPLRVPEPVTPPPVAPAPPVVPVPAQPATADAPFEQADPDPAASRQVTTVAIDPPKEAPKEGARPRPRHRQKPAAHPPTPTPTPERVHARARPAPPVRAPAPAPARAADEPSPSQQREETLLQCRAWGYNERQCIARGCKMTRFGLACRG